MTCNDEVAIAYGHAAAAIIRECLKGASTMDAVRAGAEESKAYPLFADYPHPSTLLAEVLEEASRGDASMDEVHAVVKKYGPSCKLCAALPVTVH